MEKNLLEELYRMKSLVSYKKGEVISEQPLPLPANGGQLGQFPSFPEPSSQRTNQQVKKQTDQLPIFDPLNPFGSNLVKCPENYTNVMDVPQPAQQQKFMEESGLNPKDSKNIPFYCSMKNMEQKLQEMGKKLNIQTPKQNVVKFVPEKFPLKYMMQGENVKKLQKALDVRDKKGQPNISGKFYNATQLALDKKAQELGLNYDRKIGLDQTTFNDIVSPRQKKEVEVVTPQVQTKNIEPVVPKQINPVAPQVNIQPITPQEPQTRRERRQARRAAR